MGEIADAILEGLLCEQCGEYIDDGLEAGYPRLCAGCKLMEEEDRKRRKKRKKKKKEEEKEEKEEEIMTYKVGDYHKSVVVGYYVRLLIRFGPTAMLRHMPKLKKLVWTEEGLTLVESHKLKKENQEWAA